MDSTGNLYIADSGNNRIRKVSAGLITTVTGTGVYAYSGDNGPAASAQINYASALTVDSVGNLYFADVNNYRIRKVSGGAITTVAGTGVSGFSGDNGPATSAQIGFVNGVAIDGTGNLYIADSSNARIRKVVGGTISTVTGNGFFGYSGDNSPSINAQIGYAYGVTADASGRQYFSDGFFHIRRISDGLISTVAGNGTYQFSGDGGPAIGAQINADDIAVDNQVNLYIADLQNYRIRKVTNGAITTAAGTGLSGFSGDGAAATNAQITEAHGLAFDVAGSLYFADRYNNRIRRVSSGLITTVAGNGTFGYSGDGGPALGAALTAPQSLAIDSHGSIYISDQDRIRKISAGVIALYAGGGPPDGALATNVALSPFSVATGGGNIFIASPSQNRVYKISPAGVLSVAAGNGTSGFSGDSGPAATAQLSFPNGIAVDSDGNLYISDSGNSRIRKVTSGVITTVAGGGSGCPQQTNELGDGCPAASSQLSSASVAVDSAANIFVADQGNNRIRKISGGIITTIAGNGSFGNLGDNGPATSAQLGNPVGIAVDGAGNLYIADFANYRIRKVTGGVISAFAGNGTFGFSGDNGPAVNAQLSYAYGVAADSSGNLYIADSNNSRIRKVSGGVITTVGGGAFGCPQQTNSSGDGCAAIEANLYPVGVSVDGAGNVFIADYGNNRVRKVSAGVINTVGGNGTYSFSGDGGPAINAQLGAPAGLAVDAADNLYIADTGNGRVRVVSSWRNHFYFCRRRNGGSHRWCPGHSCHLFPASCRSGGQHRNGLYRRQRRSPPSKSILGHYQHRDDLCRHRELSVSGRWGNCRG